MFSSLGIAQRLLFSLFVFSLLPILLLGYGFLESFQASVVERVTRQVAELGDKKVDQISTYLDERLDDIHLLARAERVSNDLEALSAVFTRHGATSEEFLRLMRQRYGYYAELVEAFGYYDLFLIDRSGTIVLTVAQESDFATNLTTGPYRATELAYVAKQAAMVLESGISNIRYYEPSGRSAIFLATPLIRDGAVRGVLALQLNTERFQAVIHATPGLGETGETNLAQRDGDAAIYLLPLKHDPGAALSHRVALGSPLAKPVQWAVTGVHGHGRAVDYHGAEVIAAWRYIPALRSGVVVKIDSREALAEVTRMWQHGVGAVCLLLLLVGVAGVRLNRSITRPVQALTAAAADISRGDWQRRAEVTRSDELGRLAASFNLMVDAVQESRTTLEKRVEERTLQLLQASNHLRLAGIVYENTSEAVVVTDAQSRILDVNAAYCQITGYDREELLGKNPRMHQSGRYNQEFYREMWRAINEEGRWTGEIWDRRKNGEIYPKWLSINAVKDANGAVIHYVGIFSDITRQKQSEEALERLAFYDVLTGLPNRALFHERLKAEMASAQRRGRMVALMFLDLDRFKWVNDTLGHAAGDELLKEIAARVHGVVRASDTVARLGGDEFTVIITDVIRPEQVGDIAAIIIREVGRPFPLREHNIHVGASIGVAVYPQDGLDQETLAKHADMAMYQAKQEGRNSYRFFSADLHAQSFDRISMEDDLHKALARSELALFYQPKVETENRRVVGMESLVRWFKPETGLVNPGQFIPLAEETGLILPMGEWILEEACRQTLAWAGEDANPLKVAVNLSARQFAHEDVVGMVRRTMERTRMRPELLELEITESMVMGNVEAAIERMRQLRELGLSLAMDDFGTGYSSLNYLKRFPITTLKIDQTFVRDLGENSSDAAIVAAVIAMAKSLGLDVVAEGVETAEQFEYLRERGCQQIQGYFFSRPLPAGEFYKFVAARTV